MQKNKLKICFLGWANSEHVKRWVKWFAAQGHEVHLLSNVYEEIEGVTVHSLQNKVVSLSDTASRSCRQNNLLTDWVKWAKFNYLSYLKYPSYIRKTKQLLKQIKPDILQGFYIGFAGYIGIFTGFHPFMVFTGGPELLFYPKKSLFHRIWVKFAMKRIDFLTHTSEEANKAAIELGMSPEKSKFMHIGIDLKTFNPHIDPGNLKKRLGIDGHPMVLSTRGLYDAHYNITTLIKAFSVVVKKIPEARLVMKYHSALEKNKFVKLAQDLGIYDKIVWVEKVDYQDMAKFYRAADVYVSLSYTDSGAVSMLEAMACGCVPVVSNLKNMREWIKDGENGFIGDSNDVYTAANSIIKIIESDEKKKTFGLKNIEIIRTQADQEKSFKALEDKSYELVGIKN
ncbi:MAG: glycosyl transferase group 1 [Candidatus Saganbacteria bacterium]|uniref:Glycosyl transferase group 1 n=1 Tax=Candidatus Saganbacteria bacterium TaxID=2575572 RepID=A0A833L2D3_UNCSA|nr:MAG: glycosyl transferase group 1 [Candidatus Saganbacteria bacterium]